MKRAGCIFCILVLWLVLFGSVAYATEEHTLLSTNVNVEITPQYTYTDSITASLSFAGNTAQCYGMVSPIRNDSVSVTVKLYIKNGSNWSFMKSWSGSASGGAAAVASGSATVGEGKYKVVVTGNVGGKEFPSKSVIKTK